MAQREQCHLWGLWNILEVFQQKVFEIFSRLFLVHLVLRPSQLLLMSSSQIFTRKHCLCLSSDLAGKMSLAETQNKIASHLCTLSFCRNLSMNTERAQEGLSIKTAGGAALVQTVDPLFITNHQSIKVVECYHTK